MGDEAVGAAIGGVFGLINDSFNRSHNAEEAQKNRDFQRQERLETQQWNLDMWNRNNEYNSLESQIARAKEAGVNPNAVLAGAGAESNPVTTSPMPGAQSSFQSQMSPVLANIGKTIAETELIKEQARGQNLTNEFDARSMESRLKLIDKNVEGLSTTIKKDLAAIDKMNIETKTLKKGFEYFADMQDAELKIKLEELNKLRNDNLKAVEEIANMKKQGELLDADIELRKNTDGYRAAILRNESDISGDNAQIADNNRFQSDLTRGFSSLTNIPIGTPEFDVMFYLWTIGKLPAYIMDVRTPLNQSSWKPSDYALPVGNYDFGFAPYKATASPRLYGTTFDKTSRIVDVVNKGAGAIGHIIPF